MFSIAITFVIPVKLSFTGMLCVITFPVPNSPKVFAPKAYTVPDFPSINICDIPDDISIISSSISNISN